MFKNIKYPISLSYVFSIAVYILCSLNSVVKPIDEGAGSALFIIGCCIIYAEKAQYED
jgi:hypothetical protein